MHCSIIVKRFNFILNNTKLNRNISYSAAEIQNELLHLKENPNQKSLIPINEDISDLTPNFPDSYNLAAYINRSHTLQSLLHLKVNLSKIEKNPYVVNKILKLNFDNDMKNHILFINDYVNMENIGEFVTKNPLIFWENIEDLKVRVNYLEAKHFNSDQIKNILTRNPFWLMFSTLRIDKRLGYFQHKFCLSGNELRQLAAKNPKVITYNLHHINTNTFVIKEEMGFNENEVKFLMLNKPKLWMINQKSLIERFNYLHNIINLAHSTLLQYPNILLSRHFRIKQRHLFLQNLGRAQYDPLEENYIPVLALYEGTDLQFCINFGKCNIEDFNLFLKTL